MSILEKHNLNILIIDDDPDIRVFFKTIVNKVSQENFNVFIAESGESGYTIVEQNAIDLIFTDFYLPDINGLDLMLKVKKLNPAINVIVMTAHADIKKAVQVLKAGAYDYLIKPIDVYELKRILERSLEREHLIRENKQMKLLLQNKFKFDNIIYQSSHMEEILNLAARSAKSNVNVLVHGESGTGKDLIANAIHYSSNRKEKPFVVVNLAALSENLIESELFGHKKGAYTGANIDRMGRFEQANNGTLFLDEVGDIPLHIQVKLLRAIQFKEIERIGDNKTKKIDVRIICATNRDLEQMVKDKIFREDLFYRLNVVNIHVKPLRERKEDIPILTDFFMKKFAKENEINIESLSREAMDSLMKYNFPGNIRELENIILRSVVLCRSNVITTRDLPSNVQNLSEDNFTFTTDLDSSYNDKVKNFEKVLIIDALKRTEGNQSAAARFLQISERKLRSRMQILNIVNNEKKKVKK